jgi:hypothetical protein
MKVVNLKYFFCEIGRPYMKFSYKKNALRRACIFWDTTPFSPLTLNGLHGIISQKTELFITTAVRTSSPTKCHNFLT